MNINDDHTVVLPHDWSANDALNVVQFLHTIIEAIWNLYGDGMNEILHCPSVRYETESNWPSVETHPNYPDGDWPF